MRRGTPAQQATEPSGVQREQKQHEGGTPAEKHDAQQAEVNQPPDHSATLARRVRPLACPFRSAVSSKARPSETDLSSGHSMDRKRSNSSRVCGAGITRPHMLTPSATIILFSITRSVKVTSPFSWRGEKRFIAVLRRGSTPETRPTEVGVTLASSLPLSGSSGDPRGQPARLRRALSYIAPVV